MSRALEREREKVRVNSSKPRRCVKSHIFWASLFFCFVCLSILLFLVYYFSHVERSVGEWNDRWMSAGGERRRQNQSVLNVMFFLCVFAAAAVALSVVFFFFFLFFLL